MLHKKRIYIMAVLVRFLFGIYTVLAGSLLDQKSVLAGKVVSKISVGASVQEGAELVKVSTLAGTATASRATTDGIVREVLVDVGEQINSGTIVARIEPQQK